MPKSHHASSTAQLLRQQARLARRQFWDKFWTVLMIAFTVGLVSLVLYIIISHHI